MSFDEAAITLAVQLKNMGRGFLTIRRDALRDAFGIGRLTQQQSQSVCEALGRQGVFVYPDPFSSGPTLRLYDQRHTIAGVAEAVTRPDSIPETALRKIAEVLARETAGKELRSDDVPWPVAFELFLHLVLGREVEAWEDLRDDRHPSELARELAVLLGLSAEVVSRQSTIRLAAAVCGFRPRRQPWSANELAGPEDTHALILPLLDSLAAANRRLTEEYDRLTKHAARILLKSDLIPGAAVELGLLGLRYRRERADGGVR